MGVLTVFKKELKSYFLSMSAYVFIGLFLLVQGYFFASFLLSTGIADMRPIIGDMAIIFMFISPLLTMRLWAEEKKRGTDILLLTSPVNIPGLIIGKFLAAVAVFAVMLLITFEFPLIMELYGTLDYGPVIGGYIGLLLIGSAFIALGNFSSSITENQIIAGVISFCLLLLFWALSWADMFLPYNIGMFFKNLSLLTHYYDFAKGILDLKAVFYYLSFIVFWLFLTGMNLERKRWS